MTCPDENRLVEYVEGLLPEDGIRTIDHHIDQCTSCRALLAGFAHGSREPTVAEPDLEPPRDERYVIHEVVGTGAMSVVYAATDRVLDRKVALKVLHDSHGNDALRMQREARAMSQLAHPNVLTVYDIAVIDGRMVLTAELVRGVTVARWLEQPQLWREILGVFVQAGRGLAAAHDAAIAHRDFKPSNVLIGDDGRVRVADFGLARRAADPAAVPAEATAREPALSQTGALVGTPLYMAPEQLAGATADARSDQFSFCVALYEALYGVRPFPATDLAGLDRAITAGPVTPPRSRRVPPGLHQLVLTGLAVDPARRHPSMTALCDRLAGYQRRRSRVVTSLVAGSAILAMTVAFAYVRSPASAPCQAPSWSGIWDPTRKQTLASAFASSPLPFARDAARSVTGELDGFTRRWSETYVSVCEATEVRHDRSARMLDLGMACLDERRGQVRALTELLIAADAKVIERAAGAVDQLGDLAACADARSLSEQPDGPRGLVLRSQVAAVTGVLARATALQIAGHYRDALALAEAELGPARSIGYRPVEAQLLVRIGTLHGVLGQAKDAERVLLDGLTAAQAAGDVAATADAAMQLALMMGGSEQQFAEAHRWMQLAQGALARLGDPPAPAARFAMIRGSVALTEGDAKEAQTQYQHAADLQTQLGERTGAAVALHGVGLGHARAGDDTTAVATYARALAVLIPALGAGHPRVADVMNDEAGALRNLGRFDESIAKARDAIAVRQDVFGGSSVAVATSLIELSGTLQSAKRFAEARVASARARAIFETTSSDLDISLALTSEGLACHGLGQLDEARDDLQKALAIQTRVLGADHPDLVAVLSGLGEIAIDRRDYADALASFERATANVEAAFGPETPSLIDPLLGAGEAELGLGDVPHAIARAERALELTRQQPDNLESAAEASFLLARALRAGRQDAARAETLARAALDAYTQLGPSSAKSRADVDAWLAKGR